MLPDGTPSSVPQTEDHRDLNPTQLWVDISIPPFNTWCRTPLRGTFAVVLRIFHLAQSRLE